VPLLRVCNPPFLNQHLNTCCAPFPGMSECRKWQLNLRAIAYVLCTNALSSSIYVSSELYLSVCMYLSMRVFRTCLSTSMDTGTHYTFGYATCAQYSFISISELRAIHSFVGKFMHTSTCTYIYAHEFVGMYMYVYRHVDSYLFMRYLDNHVNALNRYVLFPLQLLLDAAVLCRKGPQTEKTIFVSDKIAEGVLFCLEELLLRCPLTSKTQVVSSPSFGF
jgi:hypothetical protein